MRIGLLLTTQEIHHKAIMEVTIEASPHTADPEVILVSEILVVSLLDKGLLSGDNPWHQAAETT